VGYPELRTSANAKEHIMGVLSKSWFESKNLYVVVAEADNFADAQQLAKTNEHHAPVFYALTAPDMEQHGILIWPDGTEEDMIFADAVNLHGERR